MVEAESWIGIFAPSFDWKCFAFVGLELLELLYKNPRETISIVLKRLKQKGKEWRKLQGDMSDRWKEQLSLNSRRAADNLSHQKEPKIILPRHFMHDSLGTPDDHSAEKRRAK